VAETWSQCQRPAEIIEDTIDLVESVRQLSDLQRELLVLFTNGYTFPDLAEKYNASVKSIGMIVESACDGLEEDNVIVDKLRHSIMKERVVSALPRNWQLSLRLRSRGYTQVDAGREIGISHTMVGRYERRRNVDMTLRKQLNGG